MFFRWGEGGGVFSGVGGVCRFRVVVIIGVYGGGFLCVSYYIFSFFFVGFVEVVVGFGEVRVASCWLT